MKVQVKIRNHQDINEFKDVKSVFIQEGFLFIVSKIDKDCEKTNPIELNIIDYYNIRD